ncbi:MAG: hypothetical protein GF341_03425 [candidate division Zixibacteria bacterium]|nr:hypothetical protein [candidate division Zixibacteria bacterium]
MDVFNDPTFWGEVMITTASRLALLAAVIWVARLAVRTPSQRRPAARLQAAASTPVPRATMTAAAGDASTPFRYIDLRRGPERAETVDRPESTTSDPLRQRLLDYLEQRETERTPS